MDVRNKTYFISDLHLGASYLDNRTAERRVVRWLDSIKHDAARLFLMGDIFDYWFEYRHVVPRGYVRFLGKLASLADSGVEIHWFTGNHDIWIFDYLPSEIGIIVHRESTLMEIDGHKFFLAHGDDVGQRSRKFRFLQGLFRNKLAQRCYACIHPDFTIALAHRWSSSSRSSHSEESERYKGENEEPLVRFAKEYSLTHDVDYFIMGHRHILLDLMLSRRSRLVILGDWIKIFSYAVFDGEHLMVDIFDDGNCSTTTNSSLEGDKL